MAGWVTEAQKSKEAKGSGGEHTWSPRTETGSPVASGEASDLGWDSEAKHTSVVKAP